MSSNNKIYGDLQDGLKKNLYRMLNCRGCGTELGLVNKAIFGISVYCPRCVRYVQAKARR